MSQQTEKMEILVRAVGRRKEAVAQVKIVKGTGKFLINKKPASDYLHNNSNSILSIQAPFEILQKQEVLEKMQDQNSINSQESSETTLNGLIPSNLDAHVKVEGGGLMGQTEAIRLAVARAVCEMNGTSEIRKNLKDKGYLTQDSRIKERRKYGLRKARKAPQYNKR
jgi:small subunit ribosomal protein S9|uniref:Small ribosomal subunit protein uS9c n=1 Tax=Hydrodictyon reticulatum TaxID=3107 RepID=A0A1W5RMX7_HYDRE|nr:ribosomal protein S9 [Hydrodictyon reticulatum]AQU64559.1 ribosomal protein S9 [Hydrodictyon reticulatum]